MWGEFEDSENAKPSLDRCEEKDKVQLSKEVHQLPEVEDAAEDTVLPLRDRIIEHIASSSLTLKSQQRYEPDLTYEERVTLAGELLEKPGHFLYRFGKHLLREHFQYFLKFEGDPEVDHYIAESLQHLNKHTAKIRVRNRRYAAMQELRRSGTYFSEKEMERRDPLLYGHLIARHQTEEERKNREEVGSDNEGEMRFSSLLLKHIDKCSEKSVKKIQEQEEDDLVEEVDTDEDNSEDDNEKDERMEDIIESREKQLFREEFYSTLYQDFLRGKDAEFDYGRVDTSDNYDLLDVRARDEEERYFDEDDDGNDDGDDAQLFNGANDAEDSAMCCG